MTEKLPDVFEEGPEHIPTPEEVQSIFEKLLEGAEFKDVQKLEDEQGLYRWDIIIAGEDGDIEYSYRRGRPSEEELSGLRVDVIFFDEEGYPVGGHSVAKYIEGEWKLTP